MAAEKTADPNMTNAADEKPKKVSKKTYDEEFPSLPSTSMSHSGKKNDDGAVEKPAVPKKTYDEEFPSLFSASKRYPKKHNIGLKKYSGDTHWDKAPVDDVKFAYALPPKLSLMPTDDTEIYAKCYLNDGKTNKMVKSCVHFGVMHYKLIHKGKTKTPADFKVTDKVKAPKKKTNGKSQEKYKNMINRKNMGFNYRG